MLRISLRQHQAPIAGSPDWLQSVRFTIDAKADRPAAREMMLGPMLQALLEEQFRLKIHRETREIPVYALTVAPGGPRLQPAVAGGCVRLDLSIPVPPPPPGRPAPVLCGAFRALAANEGIEARGVTTADLCREFSAWLDRDTVDRTGLDGVFDVRLDLSLADLGGARDVVPKSASPTAPHDAAAALAKALAKVGLRLEPAHGRGEFLVIERVELPSGGVGFEKAGHPGKAAIAGDFGQGAAVGMPRRRVGAAVEQ